MPFGLRLGPAPASSLGTSPAGLLLPQPQQSTSAEQANPNPIHRVETIMFTRIP